MSHSLKATDNDNDNDNKKDSSSSQSTFSFRQVREQLLPPAPGRFGHDSLVSASSVQMQSRGCLLLPVAQFYPRPFTVDPPARIQSKMRIASSVFDMSGGHITECVSLSRRSRIHAAAKRDIETISSSTNGQVQVPAASLMNLSLSEHCRR